MGSATVVFLVVGAVGAAVLLLSLVVGELFHLGHADADGPFSLPAIAGFVGAFGFVGAVASALAGGTGSRAITVGVVAGALAGLPVAWFAARLTRAMLRMNTDATLTPTHLVGATGIVISTIPASGYGQVRLSVAGQQLKFNARAAEPLATGTSVFVIAVPSETSVEVVSTSSNG